MNLLYHQSNRRQSLQFESLEPRAMLDGDDVLLANDAYLTLSFADDGVQAAGQASALYSKFNAIAPEAQWKKQILSAFQTWSINTGADIGVRDDGGQPFGSPGSTFRDSRFGDIRIGAIAMDPNIGAVSVPIDGVVGGTWLGDVLFNTQFNFTSLDDLFAIALHEAGNVFGLEDNQEAGSPLNTDEFPNATVPTASDIANLQALYGIRPEDPNESLENNGNPNNDNFAWATQIKVYETEDDVEGPIPSLVYGDIGASGDVDFFRLPNIDGYTGPITFKVRTAGISLLTPRLRVYNDAQQLLGETTSASMVGDQLTFTLPATPEERDYFVTVEAAPGATFNIGGYSLSATFDALNEMPPEVLSGYADGSLRKLTPDQVENVLQPDEDDLVEIDLHTNDSPATAQAITIDADFAVGARFELNASISSATDRDYYSFKSPGTFAGATGFLTISVRSTTAGGLIPNIAVTDANNVPLPTEILLNGGGQVVVQAGGVMPDTDVIVAIDGDNTVGLFATGNYQLAASFTDAPIQFDSFAAGTLAPTDYAKTHTFYVGQPQLFQFRLNATGGTPLSAVLATLRDDTGQVLRRFAAPAGENRTQDAVLLGSGTYSIEFSPISLYEPITAAIHYDLSGLALSDPFAGDPDDPTNQPFACEEPEFAGFFCYPGEFISSDPFLWDDFIDALADPPPPLSVQQLVDLLLGDWWSWVWEQAGVNGPPLALDDRFDVLGSGGGPSAATLTTAPNVLANDIDPEGGQFVAVLTGGAMHGTLDLAPDGTVTYVPDPGFFGTDSFTYLAYDFIQDSTPATAYVVVGSGLAGDYDSSGTVDAADYAVWKATLGSTTQFEADGNHDQQISLADYTIWRDNLGATATPPTAAATAIDDTASDPSTSTSIVVEYDVSTATATTSASVVAPQVRFVSSSQRVSFHNEPRATSLRTLSQDWLLLDRAAEQPNERKTLAPATSLRNTAASDEAFAAWPRRLGKSLAPALDRISRE